MNLIEMLPKKLVLYATFICRQYVGAFSPPVSGGQLSQMMTTTTSSRSARCGRFQLLLRVHDTNRAHDISSIVFHRDDIGKPDDEFTVMTNIHSTNSLLTVKDLDTFYRTHMHHRAPPRKPKDLQFSLIQQPTTTPTPILATLRITPRPQGWVFLRSLCVATCERRKGLARQLLNETLTELSCMNARSPDESFTNMPTSIQGVYCFAEPKLSPLYTQAGFQEWNGHDDGDHILEEDQPSTITISPPPRFALDQYHSLVQRLSLKQSFAGLRFFFHTLNDNNSNNDNDDRCSSLSPLLNKGSKTRSHSETSENNPTPTRHDKQAVTHIILLQHAHEQHRRSATWSLAEHVADDLRITLWQWSGRADNPTIQRHLAEYHLLPILLWTGGKATLSEIQQPQQQHQDVSTTSTADVVVNHNDVSSFPTAGQMVCVVGWHLARGQGHVSQDSLLTHFSSVDYTAHSIVAVQS